MQFVYVMTATDKEKMLQLGYSLLKEDRNNHTWIFAASEDLFFSENDPLADAGVRYVLSNTLTF